MYRALVVAFISLIPVSLLAKSVRQPFGVCPPFPLRDEAGKLINPAADQQVAVPYSPEQTCGANGCHDYDKITQGFHFQECNGGAWGRRAREKGAAHRAGQTGCAHGLL